jgi:hypothetical protein
VSRGYRWISVAVMALSLAAIAPAQAAKPQKERIAFSGDVLFFPCEDLGFDVRVTFFGTDMVTRFYDNAGKLVRVVDHSRGTGTLYNSTDPTKKETGSSPTTLIWDLDDMTFTVNGMTFHNNIPGQGRVAQDTGSITWELLSYDPVTGAFELGDLIHSGGKHPDFAEIDWCSMVA